MARKEQALRPGAAAPKRPLPTFPAHEPAHRDAQAHPAHTFARVKARPLSVTAREVTQLQRAVGNRAVGRLLSAALDRRPAAPHARTADDPETDAAASGDAPKRGSQTGLPDELRAGFERLSGLTLDDVRVHYNSGAPARVGALAYARGADIHVAPGQEKHLAHEAWHVVQQRQGRVRPTLRARGLEVNDDARLEAEADAMGGRALHFGPAPSSSPPPRSARVEAVASPLSSPAIQMRRFADDDEAITWLVTAITTVLTGARTANAGNFTAGRLDTYLGRLAAGLDDFDKMSKLLRDQGGAYYDAEHRMANLTSQLSKESVKAEAIRRVRAQELTRHYGQKARTVTADQQEHIFLGTVDNAQNPTTVTGYHWEGDPASVAVSVGAKQNTEAHFGVYQRGVAARARATTRKAGGSATASTFFPDTWSKADVLEAIEYAQGVGVRLEARTPAKAVGMMILSNPDSFFPDDPANQPDA